MKWLMAFLFLIPSLALALPRAADDNLTRLIAKSRREQIKSVAYDLSFVFKKKSESFNGEVTLHLELKHTKTPLSLDLHRQKISKIEVNGVELKRYPRRTGSLDLPAEVLKPQTVVKISYTDGYSKESSGFQRSVDPEDGGEYIFTDFEPYYAHWLFPCFDQPDLKAVFNLRVEAPADWKVIHNELPQTEKTEGEVQTVVFRPTPPLSTYLFFVGAGPFAMWTDSYGKTPLHLYARQTLAKYMDADRIFEVTKQGLKFYNDYFGTPYPFSKYGQLFIPEFQWGGMENPGAVALSERNVFRGAVTPAKMEDRDNLILHEMAHMWFGDLVTMEWWNDLWLNESFATYSASIAMDRGTDSKGTWIDFLGTKAWGYWQDQLVTTHPIETNVPDTRTARGNFDGITYAKGASALKQLHFLVGEDGFREGVRHYFKTYAFKNTRREDFIGAIGKASNHNLDEWTNRWLQTAGPHRVDVAIKCDDNKIKKITITQAKNASGVLSPHRTRLGLYQIKGQALESLTHHDVVYSAATTVVPELVGKPCPDFVMPNQDDMDYALFSLDQNSLTHVDKALVHLPDALSRDGLWTILLQMVRDQTLSPLKMMELAQVAMQTEQDDILLGFLLGRHSNLRPQYFTYLTPEQRAQIAPALESMLWERITRAKAGSGLQLVFFDYYVSVAQTEASQTRLYEMLTQDKLPRGIKLDQDRRWAVVVNLAGLGHAKTEELIQQEKAHDPSTQGVRMVFAAHAAMPTKAAKQAAWKEIFGNKDLTYSALKEAGRTIHNPNRPDLSQAFVDAFFQRVRKMDWKKDDSTVDIYFESFFPSNVCSQALLERSRAEMEKVRLTPLVRRAWLEANDELSRCIKVRAKAKATTPTA